MDLERVNQELGKQPLKLIEWACAQNDHAICTTNFGPFEAVILHMVTRVKPDMPIVWMDSGYATPATYRFADEVTRLLKLNLCVYHPLRSRAHREALDGATPAVDDPRHYAFTREVKLEPFERAMRELAPRVWFTAVRAEQTAVRAQMAPVSVNQDGLIKVAPVLYWTSKDMNDYLQTNGLPNNLDYFDPTKVEDKRECGLHLAH